MGQDIRELLKNESFLDDTHIPEMSKNHEQIFLSKLESSFSETEKEHPTVVSLVSNRKSYYSIAASAVILIAFASYFLMNNVQQPSDEIVYDLSKNTTEVIPSLAEVSPEFKEVEDYYLASINVELANLKVSGENRPMVDSFMKQLSRLDDEYKVLQKELQSEGAHTYTIEALISNLQMRLELLQQLKQNLKNINENTSTTYQNLQV